MAAEAPVEIVITVGSTNSKNDITVEPTVAHVSPFTPISWRAPDRTLLLIVFEDAAAVGASEIRPQSELANVVRATAQEAKGTYHYKVVVAQASNIVGIFGSPTIIIQ